VEYRRSLPALGEAREVGFRLAWDAFPCFDNIGTAKPEYWAQNYFAGPKKPEIRALPCRHMGGSMAEKTVRICDLCLQSPGEIAVSSGAIAWRGFRGTVDVCQEHQTALEEITGAPITPTPEKGRTETEGQVAAPARKRGRPAKAAATKQALDAPSPAPRRRGRPPKVAKPEPSVAPTPGTKVTAESKDKKSVLTPSAATIRAWARANNVPVSERGGVGAATLSAYYQAHPDITDMPMPKPQKEPVRGHRVPARKRATKLAGKPAARKSGRPAKTSKSASAKKEKAVPAAKFSGVAG
jgi:hypothetical protein